MRNTHPLLLSSMDEAMELWITCHLRKYAAEWLSPSLLVLVTRVDVDCSENSLRQLLMILLTPKLTQPPA